MTKRIDAKGKACPMPVILAKKEIDGGCAAFVVEVDNETAVKNLQKLAESQGYASPGLCFGSLRWGRQL